MLISIDCFAGKVDVGGQTINTYFYFQPKYDSGSAVTDQFTISRARFDLWGDVGDKSSYFVEIDAASSQPLVYSWVDVKLDDHNKLTFGRIFYPFSLEYSTPPCKFDTINPTNMLWYYFGYSRDIGVQVGGKYDLFKYYLAVVNGRDFQMTDDNEVKDIVGRFVFSPIKDLGIGASYYNGKSGTTEADKLIGGAEISYTYDQFNIKTEYYSGQHLGNFSRGWYAQLAYYVIPSFQELIKYEDWDPDLGLSGDSKYSTTLGMNWFFDKTAKLQVNYVFNVEESVEVENNEFIVQVQLAY